MYIIAKDKTKTVQLLINCLHNSYEC